MNKKRIVVKIGSSVIAPGGKLDARLVSSLVKDVLRVENNGYKIILVTSGAIACGLAKLNRKKRPQDTYELMAISSFGQILLMDIFNANFQQHKKMCAQMLLIWDDFNDRTRFNNIRKTIEKLLTMDIIPIINENDAVSFEEIGFGDNDRLSALVAEVAGAQQLIILSDVDGLLDGDVVVKEVCGISEDIRSLVKTHKKFLTVGGMDTKLQAVAQANLFGITARIVNGRLKRIISRTLKGEDIGTVFLPQAKIEKSRKRWIHSKQIRGRIYIDEGARDALLNKGRSLLSVGITEVTSGFRKGDAVMVLDENGDVLGCGLVNYDSDIFRGSTKKKLEREVIHRDNFVKAVQGCHFYPDTERKKTSSQD